MDTTNKMDTHLHGHEQTQYVEGGIRDQQPTGIMSH